MGFVGLVVAILASFVDRPLYCALCFSLCLVSCAALFFFRACDGRVRALDQAALLARSGRDAR